MREIIRFSKAILQMKRVYNFVILHGFTSAKLSKFHDRPYKCFVLQIFRFLDPNLLVTPWISLNERSPAERPILFFTIWKKILFFLLLKKKLVKLRKYGNFFALMTRRERGCNLKKTKKKLRKIFFSEIKFFDSHPQILFIYWKFKWIVEIHFCS